MDRDKAYREVRRAIECGDLVRPSECELCGNTPPPASDGRSTIHAHHEDYSKPLDVIWLCARCHRSITPLPSVMGAPTYGERNGQAKLTEEIVKRIIESGKSARQLARELGVDHRTVSRVRSGDRWAIAAAPQRGGE